MSATQANLDNEFFAKELHGFVPDRVYDVHAHLYTSTTWTEECKAALVSAAKGDVTLELYRKEMKSILPGREIHGMHFTFPGRYADMEAGFKHANQWTSSEVATDPGACGHLLVHPGDDPERVREEVKRLGFRGLKPYGIYASVESFWDAEVHDYLPEPMVAVAADEGWSITLHLMRKDGPSDPSNQHWIRRYCEKYPDMQLILARCARGFNPYQAMKGLSGLTGLDNLWVDTSAVCSPMSIEAVLRTIGPERTLYGSDYPVSHCRGTNFPVADSFMWVYEDTPIWGGAKWTLLRPALIGLENLLATKMACWSLGLSDSQIEGIFWRNSAQVLGIQ